MSDKHKLFLFECVLSTVLVWNFVLTLMVIEVFKRAHP